MSSNTIRPRPRSKKRSHRSSYWHIGQAPSTNNRILHSIMLRMISLPIMVGKSKQREGQEKGTGVVFNISSRLSPPEMGEMG